MDGEEPTFKTALVERILRNTWDNASAHVDEYYNEEKEEPSGQVVKIQSDACRMTAELMRLFVLEALKRSQEEAMVDGSTQVEPRHIEQILSLLMLDF